MLILKVHHFQSLIAKVLRLPRHCEVKHGLTMLTCTVPPVLRPRIQPAVQSDIMTIFAVPVWVRTGRSKYSKYSHPSVAHRFIHSSILTAFLQCEFSHVHTKWGHHFLMIYMQHLNSFVVFHRWSCRPFPVHFLKGRHLHVRLCHYWIVWLGTAHYWYSLHSACGTVQ